MRAEHIVSTSARSLVLLRILTLYPVALAWQSGTPRASEVALLFALVASTSLLALRWRAVVPHVSRHITWAALDVVVSLMVLAQAGTSSAFVVYTFTTAMLVGLLFTRPAAVLLTTLLVCGYLLLAGLESSTGRTDTWAGFTAPAAYVLLAIAGAAFRRMHDRLAAAVDAAAAAERAAVTATERNRLARDLHDGVSSSLQGLVLQSMAVARSASGESPETARMADELEQAARTALAQSREVLTGLRRDDDSAPLLQAVSDRTRRWTERTGIAVTFQSGGVADLDAPPRIAALRVLDEALENVHRHSGASSVRVSLTGDDRLVHLLIEDDGTGLGKGSGVREGHYGVLGMSERAAVVGGELVVEDRTAADGHIGGTRVLLTLPRTSLTAPAIGATR